MIGYIGCSIFGTLVSSVACTVYCASFESGRVYGRCTGADGERAGDTHSQLTHDPLALQLSLTIPRGERQTHTSAPSDTENHNRTDRETTHLRIESNKNEGSAIGRISVHSPAPSNQPCRLEAVWTRRIFTGSARRPLPRPTIPCNRKRW